MPAMDVLSHPKTNPSAFCIWNSIVVTIFSLIHCRGVNFHFVTTNPPVIDPADAAATVITPANEIKHIIIY